MPKNAVTPIPDGYLIAPIGGKHYPMKLTDEQIPVAYGFIRYDTGEAVRYSRRTYALAFIVNYEAGNVGWAAPLVSGQEKAGAPS